MTIRHPAPTSEIGDTDRHPRATRLPPGLVADLKNARDNRTNARHIAGVWAIIALAAAAAIAAMAWAPLWLAAMTTAAAIVVIGASQHQLGGAGHEATHFTLFRNRIMNEAVSDWLCMFPLYATTHQFRLHHLAHHQFVNDPARDPDLTQLSDSGHHLDFPLPPLAFVGALMRQLWLLPLARYTVVRARYNALGVDRGPYRLPGHEGSRLPDIVVGVYGLVVPAVLVALWPLLGGWGVVAAFLATATVALAILAAIPEAKYRAAALRPVMAHRTTALSRVIFFAVVYCGLSTIQAATGAEAWLTYGLLWLVPLFTTFPFFMIMRQWVQHGNADRGRVTNTRVFLVGPFVRYAVFPFGMDYHLPHHLYAAVPHFKLPELHDLLMRHDTAYARDAVVTDGYFRNGSPGAHPSVLDVLSRRGPSAGDVYIAADTLDDAVVASSARIAEEEAASLAAGGRP